MKNIFIYFLFISSSLCAHDEKTAKEGTLSLLTVLNNANSFDNLPVYLLGDLANNTKLLTKYFSLKKRIKELEEIEDKKNPEQESKVSELKKQIEEDFNRIAKISRACPRDG